MNCIHSCNVSFFVTCISQKKICKALPEVHLKIDIEMLVSKGR